MDRDESPPYGDLDLAKRLWKRQAELEKETSKNANELRAAMMESLNAHRLNTTTLNKEVVDLLNATNARLWQAEQRQRDANARSNRATSIYGVCLVVLAACMAYSSSVWAAYVRDNK